MNKLYVIGIGPGDPREMTLRAADALKESEVVAGYGVYIDLVKPMLGEKEYIVTPMRQEVERCRMALESAASGRTTAMISSGDAVLETAQLLKKKKAGKIFICATFGILTGGTTPFDSAYKRGLFTKLITTNLVYQPEELLKKPYYISCDMSKYIALIIDTLNHDCSLSGLLNPVDRINRVLERYARGEKI